jgi:Arc/MetJ-type ribon-helix-helix transcriptional regulator
MDSVSVTKSIRVSSEMATAMDNLIGRGDFQTTSDLILKALEQFLEANDHKSHTKILRLKVSAEIERRLKVLVEAGDGPTVEDAAVRVLREHSLARAKMLAEETAEFNKLHGVLRQQQVDAAIASKRDGVVTK